MNKFFSYICNVMIIIIIFLTVIQVTALDLPFFRHEYHDLNISENIKMSEDELMEVTEYLVDYIKGDKDDLLIQATIDGEERQVFNEKEIAHMKDVKNLYTSFMKLRNFFVIMVVAYLIYLILSKKLFDLTDTYFKVLAMFIVLTLTIIFMCFVDFYSAWNSFHKIFFRNDLWLLNPHTDILVNMVPQQFFVDLVTRIGAILISSITALSGIMFIFKRR